MVNISVSNAGILDTIRDKPIVVPLDKSLRVPGERSKPFFFFFFFFRHCSGCFPLNVAHLERLIRHVR